MITQLLITDTSWTPITQAGVNATVWIDEEQDSGSGQVKIFHSTEGVPAPEDVTKGKNLLKSSGNNDAMVLDSDNAGDIFYARCVQGSALISVDRIAIGHLHEMDTHAQSSTSRLFQYFLMNELQTGITLAAEASVDSFTLTLTAGHGFTAAAGEVLVIRNINFCEQFTVKSVVGNVITLYLPTSHIYPITSIITRGNIKMNVDGSVTPVQFKFTMGDGTIPIDVSRVIVSFQSGSTVPDHGTFGGLPILTNGVYFRKINGEHFNLGNYRSNQDFIEFGADVIYSSKAPSGTNGTEIVVNLESTFGQVIRIDPRSGDSLFATVRDNLTTLARFTVSLIGSYTEGE